MLQTNTKILFQLPKALDDKIERVCSSLQMKKSLFIRNAIAASLNEFENTKATLDASGENDRETSLHAFEWVAIGVIALALLVNAFHTFG